MLLKASKYALLQITQKMRVSGCKQDENPDFSEGSLTSYSPVL